MKIRKATLADIDSCIHLTNIPEFPYYRKIARNERRTYLAEFIHGGTMLVAEEDSGILGFCAAEPMLGKFAYLDAIAVHKGHRGKGIGRALFTALKKELRKKRIHNIYLIAPSFNKKTLNFYRTMGMKASHHGVEFYLDF